MKRLSEIFLLLILLDPIISFACSPVSPIRQKMIDNRYSTIFIGKIVERKLLRNSFGEIEKISLKFLPLKVRKGGVSLDEYFWIASSRESLDFIVGDSAYVYADKQNEMAIGDWCHLLSGSLGRMTPKQIDEMVIDWKLEQAIGSDSRSELLWAKSHIENEVGKLSNDSEKKYWLEQLELIEIRLSKVY